MNPTSAVRIGRLTRDQRRDPRLRDTVARLLALPPATHKIFWELDQWHVWIARRSSQPVSAAGVYLTREGLARLMLPLHTSQQTHVCQAADDQTAFSQSLEPLLIEVDAWLDQHADTVVHLECDHHHAAMLHRHEYRTLTRAITFAASAAQIRPISAPAKSLPRKVFGIGLPQIRQLDPRDPQQQSRLVTLLQRTYAQAIDFPELMIGRPSVAHFTDLLQSSSSDLCCHVIGTDADDAGMLLATRRAEETSVLYVGVVPESRRCGLARRLVEHLAETLQDSAIEIPEQLDPGDDWRASDTVRNPGATEPRVLIQADARNEAAIACYTSLGFSQVDFQPVWYRYPTRIGH